jgi:hypothetical protein
MNWPFLKGLRKSEIFTRECPALSGVEAIFWWESRRIPYNLIVGSAGIVTCIAVMAIATAAEIFFHSDFGLPDPPFFSYSVSSSTAYWPTFAIRAAG